MERRLHIPGDFLIGAIALLDSLPEAIRAMLAALLLVAFLRLFESRIATRELQLGLSFRKTALVSLLLIPLFVLLFPASRMVVFVEELPSAGGPQHWIWQVVVGFWALGCLTGMVQLVRRHRRSRVERQTLAVLDDEKLTARVAHWRRRLGMQQPLTLKEVAGNRPVHSRSENTILLPAAARHWPGNVQDILLIQTLCHLQRRHHRWHLIGQMVSCIYWPVCWVQGLHRNLLTDFQRSADRLAESCYQDNIGYDRALRQLEQRLGPPVAARRRTASVDSQARLKLSGRLAATGLIITDYLKEICRLLSPSAEPDWHIEGLLAQRQHDQPLLWTDPYDKVGLFVVQSVFFAFLLTGVTLKEKPPELEADYAMPFELLWKQHFHRNRELLDRFEGR